MSQPAGAVVALVAFLGSGCGVVSRASTVPDNRATVPPMASATRTGSQAAGRGELAAFQAVLRFRDGVHQDDAWVPNCRLRAVLGVDDASVLGAPWTARLRDSTPALCNLGSRGAGQVAGDPRPVVVVVSLSSTDTTRIGPHVARAPGFIVRLNTTWPRRELHQMVEEFSVIHSSYWAETRGWTVVSYRWWPRPAED